ncbi:MAG: WecB/TagA/CpsF family glycosyltransferase [Planctomycetota bacterium]|jgi:N-acetylglucosaminyldiphosphoundecaprenol N-acetyl-beta-D-mannosaminyltransferase
MDDKRVEVKNVPVTCIRMEQVLEYMRGTIVNKNERHYTSITNTESMYWAVRDQVHRDIICNATFSLCDGVGVVIAGKFYGYDIPRLHGPDYMLECCKYGVQHGWRHFFIGGKDDTAGILAMRMEEKFPGFISAGTYRPPFRKLTGEEEDKMIDLINDSNADIVWIGLGLLKQERWIKKYKDRIDAIWFCGVGAAFDFHTGKVKRAPLIYQKIGLEWLYRLIFEPRMFIRNVRSFAFVFSAIFDGLKYRLISRS